jgi:PAS domain-containing protein
MARALRERRGFNGCEVLIGLPGGERRAVLAHANPVLDEGGAMRGAINVLVDVSRQRQTERELRESERFARATVNSLAANIAILDEAGGILSVNSAWRRFADDNGMPPCGHGVGANYLGVCDRAAAAGDAVAAAAAAGIRSVLRRERDVFELEYPCHSPDEQRWILMRATPFDGDGPTRIVVNHENVTARKTAERLAREQLGLREAVAGMEQVLGVVGHELRTPLAALRAITEFLATDGARDTAEAGRFLARWPRRSTGCRTR